MPQRWVNAIQRLHGLFLGLLGGHSGKVTLGQEGVGPAACVFKVQHFLDVLGLGLWQMLKQGGKWELIGLAKSVNVFSHSLHSPILCVGAGSEFFHIFWDCDIISRSLSFIYKLLKVIYIVWTYSYTFRKVISFCAVSFRHYANWFCAKFFSGISSNKSWAC